MSLNRSVRSSDTDSMKEGRGYWGFANFQNQVFRRAVKSGFDFTLMVVGRGGLGKSTFINTLFLAEINDLSHPQPATTGSTVRIEEKFVKLIENGVSLNLTLVDTPGFGDNINNSKCWEPVLNYVESKFLAYFCDETRVERKEKPIDKCVHLCLYFIEPSGHGLKPIDVEFMKQLMGHVNIVPVIAKADCLTAEEMAKFKKQIRADIEKHELKLYQFPELSEEAPDKSVGDKLKHRLPFAVVGSNSVADGPNGKKTRYRKYPWGVVEVENLEHNDFIPLRDIIVRTNLIDLIDVTRSVHYENFRFRQMEKLPQGKGDQDPFTLMEEERKRKERDLQDKKLKLENTFKEKITERETRIKQKTDKLDEKENRFKEELEARRRELEALRHEVEEMRKGNFTDSKSSLNSQSSSQASANENQPKTSPPVNEKTRKKMATLSIFNRN